MSLPVRPDLDPAPVLARLAPSLAGAELTVVGEGWDNIVYAVAAPGVTDLVLRVAKEPDPAERRRIAERDVALLELAASTLTVATNRVVAADLDEGILLVTAVPGVPMTAAPPADSAALGAAIGRALAGLHATPVHLVPEHGPAITLTDWLRRTATELTDIDHLLTAHDRDRFRRFLLGPVPMAPPRMVFCHNDLGEDHLFVDPVTGVLTGIIDWSDAVVGDPARDFALILFDVGEAAFEAALTAYNNDDPELPSRARWFAVRAGLAGLAQRLRTDDGVRPVLDRLRTLTR